MNDVVRKLAVVSTVDQIIPIPNADTICQYRVGGWKVVDRINAHNVGDKVIYYSIDSWIPNKLAPFLSKGKQPKEYNSILGERLRTIKLRGAYSQGLIQKFSDVGLDPYYYEVGDDLTDTLGIQKWEKPVPANLRGVVRSSFPTQWIRTDQERIQNLAGSLNDWRYHFFEVTEKLDGTSASYGFIDGEFIVCSRNLSLKESDTNVYWQVARELDIEQKMRDNALTHMVLQGEIIGEGIQKNHYKLNNKQFYLFDVYDVGTKSYVLTEERQRIARMMNINHVPVVEKRMSITDETIDSLLEMADGFSLLKNDRLREGIVFKSTFDGSISFKSISNKWLLKNE